MPIITQYATNTHYKCNPSSCVVTSTSRIPVFTDNRASVRKGNFVTPMAYSRSITKTYPSWWRRYTHSSAGTYVSEYEDNYDGFASFVETIEDNLSGRNLSAELVDKFNQTTLNLSMMAKDLYDASNMALDYFKRVNRCWKDLKRGNFRRAFGAFSGSRKLSKGMANNWLAFQYGVLPTIHSVQDAFAAANNQKAQTIRLVCTVSGSRSSRPKVNTYNRYYGQRVEKVSLRGFRYFTTKDSIRQLLVTNQVEVAWDATPYSFLLDWFVPIGDYLKQFGYSNNLRASTGCDSRRSHTTQYSGGSYWKNANQIGQQNGEVRRENITFSRTLNSNIVWRPSFSEVFNQSRIGLSTNRCANAFALLVQRTR
jgi:hypothetical protein